MLYYLPVTAFGSFTRRTNGLSACLKQFNHPGKLSIFLFIPGLAMVETRLHGSKHGNPASADAARPQGINDQFFAGPD
jgi:hypothetical protein